MVFYSLWTSSNWTGVVSWSLIWSFLGWWCCEIYKMIFQSSKKSTLFRVLKYLPCWPEFCWSQPQGQLPGNQGGRGSSYFPTQCTINHYSLHSLLIWMQKGISSSNVPCSCFDKKGDEGCETFKQNVGRFYTYYSTNRMMARKLKYCFAYLAGDVWHMCFVNMLGC